LALDFLCAVAKRSVQLGMFFDRVMTNGVWFKDGAQLVRSLRRFKAAGYDGSIGLSVDAFHRQPMDKLVLFIKTAAEIWGRADVVFLAVVRGARDRQTRDKLKRLAWLMGGELKKVSRDQSFIKNDDIFMRISPIDLSAVDTAQGLCRHWNGKWFKEDYCRGPGNVFFVQPDGAIKPCCGYAVDLDQLTIGNIYHDSPRQVLINASKNLLVDRIFTRGLTWVRRSLLKLGADFPGQTENHCYFCWYIGKNISPARLLAALKISI